MQTRIKTSSKPLFSGIAAIAAGIMYSSRWIWEIAEGVLKHKQYPPSFMTQNFFVVKLLLIIALLGVFQTAAKGRLSRSGIIVACFGLAWMAVTRTFEAYGASGPWGFYSSPGLLFFFLGLLTAGLIMAKEKPYEIAGRILMAISVFFFSGGLTSALLFNLLGRDEKANEAASYVANLLLISEGICWIILGVYLVLLKMQAAKETAYVA